MLFDYIFGVLDVLLDDKQWHEVKEILDDLDQPEEKIDVVLSFYEKSGFIQFDETRRKTISILRSRSISNEEF